MYYDEAESNNISVSRLANLQYKLSGSVVLLPDDTVPKSGKVSQGNRPPDKTERGGDGK